MEEVVIGEREGWEEGKNGRNVIGEREGKSVVEKGYSVMKERYVRKKRHNWRQ